jgi:hypothetical protein
LRVECGQLNPKSAIRNPQSEIRNCSMTSTSSASTAPATHNRRGRWIVIGMLLFGVALTATDWVYWKLHVAPFLPLQKLLAENYDGSRPRVEGGQRKMHKGTPKILRVTMKLKFDPAAKDGKRRVDEFSRELAAFVARNYPELADYEILELNLYWPKPETELKPLEVQREFPVKTLLPARGDR